MLGNAAYIIFLFLAILAVAFFFWGIFAAYAYPFSTRSRNLFYICAFCLSSSLFAFLVSENGFLVEYLYYSTFLMTVLIFLISVDYFIRKKTQKYLGIRDASSLKNAFEKFIKEIKYPLSGKDNNTK